MGKSSNGPGWTDVYALAVALQQHSGGTVHVELHPLQNSSVERFQVVCFLVVNGAGGLDGSLVLRHDGIYPNADFTTLEATVYSGVLLLDQELARHWRQANLPMP